jgi:hypothetical protein
MSGPGFVITPGGSKKLVSDKWAYFLEHPESYQRTLDDINAIAAIKAAREANDENQIQSQPVRTEKSLGICCVDKWVLTACKECNAS